MDYDFGPVVQLYSRTGSRYICNPAPVDTDEDFIAFVADDAKARAALESMGYILEGAPEFYTGNDNGVFRSYRKGDINIITSPDQNFFRLFVTATELAKRFNLLDKGDRIALFQAVLYGVDVDDLEESRSVSDTFGIY